MQAEENTKATSNNTGWKPKYTLTAQKDGKYEVEISIPAKLFEDTYKGLFKHTAENQKVSGFRKGNVPQELLEKEIGPAVMQETFARLAPYMIEIVAMEEKLSIAPPIKYTSVPKNFILGSDITFKVELLTFPEVKLPDLTKIKLNIKKTEVSDEQLEDLVKQTFESQTPKDIKEKFTEPNDEWAVEFAKALGIPDIKNLEDLRKEFKEYLESEFERQASYQAMEDAFTEALEKANIKIADETIEFEAQKKEEDLKAQLEQAETTIERYCEANNLKLEDLRADWRMDAEMAYKTTLFLFAITKEYDIKVSDEELEHEIEHMKEHYQGKVDPTIFESEQWRSELRSQILQKKAYAKFAEIVSEANAPKKTANKAEKKDKKEEKKSK